MEAVEIAITELEALRELLASLAAACEDASLLDLVCKILTQC